MSIGLPPTAASESKATSGSFPGPGTYFCLACGSQLAIRENDRMPPCPRCDARSFRLDSIFSPMQDHGAATVDFDAPGDLGQPDWVAELRDGLAPGSRHLVCRPRGGEIVDFPVAQGWTRIGRSVSADIRLDDPSVSRRHALVVSEPGHALRVLDDRSLNGVMVNGEVVEWGKLEDGDELTIGSFRLFVVEP